MDMLWIMTPQEFDREAVKNKTGKNIGLRSIWFNGKRKNNATATYEEYCRLQWEKYVATNFGRIVNNAA